MNALDNRTEVVAPPQKPSLLELARQGAVILNQTISVVFGGAFERTPEREAHRDAERSAVGLPPKWTR